MLNVQKSPTHQALPIWIGFRGNLEDIRMLPQDGASEDGPGHALLLLSHEVPQSRTVWCRAPSWDPLAAQSHSLLHPNSELDLPLLPNRARTS